MANGHRFMGGQFQFRLVTPSCDKTDVDLHPFASPLVSQACSCLVPATTTITDHVTTTIQATETDYITSTTEVPTTTTNTETATQTVQNQPSFTRVIDGLIGCIYSGYASFDTGLFDYPDGYLYCGL